MNPSQLYDVSNGVMHQVYGGMESENAEANRAVDETKGMVLLNLDNKPLEAFFHAACGGETDLPEAVWPARVTDSHYGTTKDTFCAEYPRQNWSTEISLSTLSSRLRKAGIKIRDVKSISIGKTMTSGRTETFDLKTSRGTVEIQGNRFRLAVGPEVVRSLMLTDITNGKRLVRFTGKGWGHGVGLCQWGARGRALAGHKYDEILRAYYPKARLVTNGVRTDEQRSNRRMTFVRKNDVQQTYDLPSQTSFVRSNVVPSFQT